MAHCATVVSLGRPYFSADRNITLTKFRQHNDHLVLRIGSWQFKPADSRPYFQTVRTSEEDRITDSEMFIADRVQARNEYEPVTLDLESVRDGEDSSCQMLTITVLGLFRRRCRCDSPLLPATRGLVQPLSVRKLPRPSTQIRAFPPADSRESHFSSGILVHRFNSLAVKSSKTPDAHAYPDAARELNSAPKRTNHGN
jgi:hypothetical protein